jgi:hypothetical protein
MLRGLLQGRGRGRGQPFKRSYQDRVEDREDYDTVNTRSSQLGSRGQVITAPRSPQKGTSWTPTTTTWGPQDDATLALEEDDLWVDAEVDREVFEIGWDNVTNVELPKKRQSKVSVRAQFRLFLFFC